MLRPRQLDRQRRARLRPALGACLAVLGFLALAPAATAGGRDGTPLSSRVVTPSSQRELFQGAGVVVANGAHFPPQRAELLRANGFRWIALWLHHGSARARPNERLLADGWADAFRVAGLRVCGWGWLDTRPRPEAALVAELVRRHRLDCWIADAEDPYMDGPYGGKSARSRLFVRAFRARLPHLPAAVTTYGAAVSPWVLPFDYAPWRERNFALMPQAYLSIASYLGPRSVIDHAVRAGYPRSRVHPMIGIGWSQQRRAQGAGDYAWRLRVAGTRGFSVFLGERTSDADFALLGRAIRGHRIARPPLPGPPPTPPAVPPPSVVP
jgi:hypothetical protein